MGESVTATTSRLDDARVAVARARAHLAGRQDRAGWWKGELRTNVTMDAEDLLLRQFLGILRFSQLEQSARWIRSQQRTDGTWATFRGGPGDLSTTVEAYAALRLAGDGVDEPHMVKAREFVLAAGGTEATRVFTRVWLALFGEWSWDELPEMPPELVLLPSWFPLNPYDWGCWARQTVVAITVVATMRPVRPLPFNLDELRTGVTPPPSKTGFTARAFVVLDKLLKAYHRSPIKPGRKTAFRRAAEWIIARQEADGGWGGIQPPMVYSILALHLLGYALDHPVIAAGLRGIDGFTSYEQTPDGRQRWIEACQSPVWDTCLAVIALRDAGAGPDDPAVKRATEWLLREEIRVEGDWAVRRPRLAPGGWAFEFANDNYPDIDDTAEVVLALRLVGDSAVPGVEAAIERGVAWTLGMQSRDGGWAAFDAENVSRLIGKLPFCDFGAVIDPPSADVTAHVLEMLAHRGLAGSEAGRRGLRCSTRRNPTAPGSGGGGPTTSTARERRCPRWSRPVSLRNHLRCARPSAGSSSTRTPTEAGARICGPMWTIRGAGGATPPRRRRPGHSWRCWPRVSAPGQSSVVSVSWSTRSVTMVGGMRIYSPGRVFRETSTSTTRCIGWCSRSVRSEGICGYANEP